MRVGFSSPRPSFLNMQYGITLILAPKSAKPLLIACSPIVQGIVKLPGSLSFSGGCLERIAEHCSLSFAEVTSVSLRLLVKISFMNFAY
ncbi:hypothetical protein LINPERHAP1_LOCUS11778 [Linum perenne]